MSRGEQLAYYQQKLAFEMDPVDLWLALKAEENIVVVDGRNRAAFEREHIPGALSLPHRALCIDTTQQLDPSKVYICYCDGIGCNASTQTALKLLTLGFQVKELIGGLDWWKRDGYATEGHQGRDGTPVSCGC